MYIELAQPFSVTMVSENIGGLGRRSMFYES